MQQFDRAQSQGGIVSWNINQRDVGIGGAHAACDWIGARNRKTGAGMHCARHAGAVHEHLQYRALLVVGRDNHD